MEQKPARGSLKHPDHGGGSNPDHQCKAAEGELGPKEFTAPAESRGGRRASGFLSAERGWYLSTLSLVSIPRITLLLSSLVFQIAGLSLLWSEI